MDEGDKLRSTFERNARAIELRPSVGQTTAKATVRMVSGTTCTFEGSGWRLVADVGEPQGGHNAGPGPGVYARAALGSCLAINYVTWAAFKGIPLEHLEVEVETDFDARGMYGLGDDPPGFRAVRYRVTVESSALESEVRRFIEEADRHCPTLDDFRRPLPIEREIQISRPEDNDER
jgi:uncharacterized OsmC-like protein